MEDDAELFSILTVTNDVDLHKETSIAAYTELKVEIDTGTAWSVLSQTKYQEKFSQPATVRLEVYNDNR